MFSEYIFWIIFAVVFIVVFAIDMYAIDHSAGKIHLKKALLWTSLWISISILFGIFIYFFLPDGNVKGLEFAAGYIIEYSLSVDNLFVFIMIFSIMGISDKEQPRILIWGILGAIVFRIIFIIVGVQLIHMFHFVIYIFGAILVYTAYKMITSSGEQIDPNKNIFLKLLSRVMKIKSDATKERFFVRENGVLYATAAFVTLILIESTDIIFAVDSIPAVLAITDDPFIAITSNLFAILGLRSLYFALAGILGIFRYLKYGVSLILFFIGVKMFLSGIYKIPIELSLAVIIVVIAGSIVLSMVIKEKKITEEEVHIKKEEGGKYKAE